MPPSKPLWQRRSLTLGRRRFMRGGRQRRSLCRHRGEGVDEAVGPPSSQAFGELRGGPSRVDHSAVKLTVGYRAPIPTAPDYLTSKACTAQTCTGRYASTHSVGYRSSPVKSTAHPDPQSGERPLIRWPRQFPPAAPLISYVTVKPRIRIWAVGSSAFQFSLCTDPCRLAKSVQCTQSECPFPIISDGPAATDFGASGRCAVNSSYRETFVRSSPHCSICVSSRVTCYRHGL
jgi:hypothetical protein